MEQISQFIINHWFLWSAFIVLLALTFVNELLAKKQKAKQLSPQAVVDLINNDEAVVIDIRDKELFKKGHIIDAINLRIDEFDKPKLAQHKDKTVIIVCDKGIQAATAATQLKAQGFQAQVMSGGLASWIEADLPLVKGK